MPSKPAPQSALNDEERAQPLAASDATTSHRRRAHARSTASTPPAPAPQSASRPGSDERAERAQEQPQGPSGPLDNELIRKNVDTQGPTKTLMPRQVAIRKARHAALLHAPAKLHSKLSFCQRTTTSTAVWHSFHPATGRASAWITNVATCKATWICPMCSASHAYAQQKQLERSMTGWSFRGDDHRAMFMTLTARRNVNRPLREALLGVTKAFTVLMNSRYARNLRASGAYFGYVRTVEITWSRSKGWHPHLHVLFFTKDVTALQAAWPIEGRRSGGTDFVKEWRRALATVSQRDDLSRPLTATADGQDLQEAKPSDAGQLAGYVTKDGVPWSIYAEMTRDDVKTGRGDSLAPLELLLKGHDGDKKALAAWREYTEATKGVHRFSPSQHRHDESGASIYELSLKDAYRFPRSRQWRSDPSISIHELLSRDADRFETYEVNIANGIGDDPRARANLARLQAEEAAFSALSRREGKSPRVV